MEASKLQKKKSSISKGKLKKTMKTVLCRPDPVFWPLVSDEHAKQLEQVLSNHKISIPEFRKLHWDELKSIPKAKRPKPPQLEKVKGLLFGITTCLKEVKNTRCAGVLLDGEINPKILAQHILEACSASNIPVLCINGLKKTCSENFGVPTSCLGLDEDSKLILDIRDKVQNISKGYKNENNKIKNKNNEEIMDIDIIKQSKPDIVTKPFTYLYRQTKTSRVFIPPSTKLCEKLTKNFIGQDFIEFSPKTEDMQKQNRKAYMNMIVKKISNNANRIKKK